MSMASFIAQGYEEVDAIGEQTHEF